MHLQDGYKFVRASQLLSGIASLNRREITFRAFRVYLGCFELQAVREAASRIRNRPGRGQIAKYRECELMKLTGFESVRKELRLLRRANLVDFSEATIEIAAATEAGEELLPNLGRRGGKRLVPIPRAMIRFLAKCPTASLALTVVAYCLRGMSLERSGELRGAGTAKASWIGRLCHLSERSVRSARAELIRLGWITKDTGSVQRKLNRDGAYFVIDTFWRRELPRIAPRLRKTARDFAPPLKRPVTPSDQKNQKLAIREPSGFQGKNFVPPLGTMSRMTKAAFGSGHAATQCSSGHSLRRPRLSNVVPGDLADSLRLSELFKQAVKSGKVKASENSQLQFFAAAEHARSVGRRNPCGLFSAIISRGLWQVITLRDEEMARQRLRFCREKKGDVAGGPQAKKSTEEGSEKLQSLLGEILKKVSMPGLGEAISGVTAC